MKHVQKPSFALFLTLCLAAAGPGACGHNGSGPAEPGLDASTGTPSTTPPAAIPSDRRDTAAAQVPADVAAPAVDTAQPATADAAMPTPDTAAVADAAAPADAGGKKDGAPAAGGRLPPAAAPPGTAAIPVLFIGNSYTYVNELPTVLAKIAQGKRTIEVEREATGGQTLEGHFGGGTGPGPAAIKKRKWTYVILQEQSTRPMSNTAAFLDYGKRLDALVDASGAQTMLYETWSRKSAPNDQKKLSDAYEQLARATDGYLAPVGAAWARVRTERPNLELFAADGSHPSFAGTYLGACVFYGMILAVSPEGVPNLELPAADAKYLQQVAWEVVQTYRF